MNEWEFHLLEDRPSPVSVTIDGVEVKAGDRVRLRPRKGGDVFDIALAGKVAVVESIEQDYEGQIHLSVVVDDDPGRDIGMMRQPGHRFFFSAAEVESIERALNAVSADAGSTDASGDNDRSGAVTMPTVLIAGIGNIFLGDDAFGVEVVNRLAGRPMPAGVRIIDFGIRGFDLACALIDGADVTIFVDACPRSGSAGDLYVIEPDTATSGDQTAPAAVDAHSMNPMNVIRAAQTMGGSIKKILVLGCEPATLGPEEGHMGLSEPVATAVERAVPLLESLVQRILRGDWPPEQLERP